MFQLAVDFHFCEMFHIKLYNLNDYLKFDCETFKRLNLLSSHAEDASSLFFMLNKCRSAHGQRMLAKWIRQPLLDVGKIGKLIAESTDCCSPSSINVL